MRIVFDTNIFIAAALKGGFSEDIIQMAANKVLTLVSSEEILKELYLKLTQKFEWTESNANYFIDLMREISEIVNIAEKVLIIDRDPADNKILECALAGEADLIVSSDLDLIKLKKFRNIAIIHPKTLAWTFPEYFKSKK